MPDFSLLCYNPEMKANSLTPMLKQYLQIKKQYPEAILFFRMGDFYEMFFEDAKIAAPILEVVLTSRNKSKEESVPLCGVPYHAMENYAVKLLKKGYKVAICEQTEDPSQAKGIVRREVVRVLTPATALEFDNLEFGSDNNYLLSIFAGTIDCAYACLDLKNGLLEVKKFLRNDIPALKDELFRISPRELLVNEDFFASWKEFFGSERLLEGIRVEKRDVSQDDFFSYENILKEHFGWETLSGTELDQFPEGMIASAMLLQYLQQVSFQSMKNLFRLKFSRQQNTLYLDSATLRNLEILSNQRGQSTKGTLFEAVDYTLTAMGKRLLRNWLAYPLLNRQEIIKRQEAVAELFSSLITRSEIRKILKGIADLARINARLALKNISPLQLIQLKEILEKFPFLKRELSYMQSEMLKEIETNLNQLEEVQQLISHYLQPQPHHQPGEGLVIREGVNQELDELRALSLNAKGVVAAIEERERQRTGIPSLKVRYNKVFGYYIEVTNAHLKLVPEDYNRKQTLVNAERFITRELKELEDKILRAEERIGQLEKEIFSELLDKLLNFLPQLQINAEMIALLDVIAGGAELAQKHSYCRPQLINEKVLEIEEGRHAVLETDRSLQFVPNDLFLNAQEQQIMILTGPNMGGKSTFLRQTALIVILAQIGYFVPAKKARLPVFDRIFTRIGAADYLLEGKSTFMVEMLEMAVILNNATKKSLILLDEVGRGTATFDGLSLAWAAVEYLHTLPEKPLTLFATHYHELTELAEVCERVKNFHIEVKEWQDNLIFLHKVMPGASDRSFGIHVAKIAGVPLKVVERAKEILLELEKKEEERLFREKIRENIVRKVPLQLNLFTRVQEISVEEKVASEILKTKIEELTPLSALNLIARWQELLSKKKGSVQD